MELRLSEEEINEALLTIVTQMVDEIPFSDRDRAMIKRWRSSAMKLGSDDMTEFVRKANEDLARGIAMRQRSPIQKHDWND
ncbi:MAG TPA: hypothetical protein VIK11_13805 [Tepidiformaceae bacterium]|jgi:hypothetical protein